ncbi:ABC transporter permease subunit [Cellulomonas sp. S1-8]|uniref:ABC transporter permease subunit n=1 Tax=Cellulomonas sp. S1-8 TaxID=2904790 RepID=UPI00224305F6|nr:ABC transporter permease subunit [Cellulomonas sp. S1-8]UZN02515.1 ABC transporter permease [Cellulomonas sp. S1-8]
MSAAATSTARSATPAAPARRGPTFAGVVAGEWTKLTSLRSTWWIAAVTVAVAGVLTYLAATASSTDPGFRPLADVTVGLLLAQVGPLVLGVLVGAGEFRSGSFRSTFTTVPTRTPVIAAQAVVTAAFGLALGVLTALACVLAVLPAAAGRGIPVDLTTDGTPGVLLGTVLLVAGLTLLGLAIGALLRSTTPALVAALTLVLVLPIVLMMVGDPAVGGAPEPGVADDAAPVVTVAGTLGVLTPGTAGQLMTTTAGSGPVPGAPDLGPGGGGLVLGAWILVLLGAAAVRLRTRDVR